MEGVFKDSNGNDVVLGEIRKAYIVDAARGVYATFKRLRNMQKGGKDVFWNMSTGENGTVVCKDFYTAWCFVTPETVSISQSGTVADVIARIRAYAVDTPPAAWDDFAVWISSGERLTTLNEYIEAGETATVYDAQGNSYSGTQRQLTACTSFVEALDWMSGCFGSDFLAAAGSTVFANNGKAAFALGTTKELITGFGNPRLSFTFRF